jgi:hypothetical protein
MTMKFITTLILRASYILIPSADGCSNSQDATVAPNPYPFLTTLTPPAFAVILLSLHQQALPPEPFTWTRAAAGGISNAAVTLPNY